jgi:putative transposase
VAPEVAGDDRYLAWEAARAEFVPFLDYPMALRTIVYTTNAIESLNAGSARRSSAAASSQPSRRLAFAFSYSGGL